ncbi:hypothetical protein J437_LFUL000262 [Ladona fulva]|uniref:Phospholipid scramblase n=1 Tax=Ladona fulva TaxID=123851 RepID=A0A8K0NVA3_LADFU|nr:hypothetical protein J437_LFUL000262 [Ladona fulva]
MIQQTVELLDPAVESENRYVIKVPRGDTIFEVAERSSEWQRAILGSSRSFYLHVFDRSRREVLQLRRRQAACSCCLCHCCCAFVQQVQVYIPPYTLLGSVTQECSLFVPTFLAKNAADDIIYKIEGPSSCIGMNMESTFKILTYDGTREVGSIMNQWNDLHLQHNLRVIFPFEENSDMRAVLLGAAFLLQYMFFESSKKASRLRLSRFNNS